MSRVASNISRNGEVEVEMSALDPATRADDARKTSTVVSGQLPECITTEGDDSDAEDEVFSDALDHIITDVAVSEPDVTAESGTADHGEPLWRRMLHKLNTILLTIGMLTGLTLAYLQWRQQAWSNQMSSIQTCLAMEVSCMVPTLRR